MSAIAATGAPAPAAGTPSRLILAGIAGNVMEWYDFTVYGYFAAVIGRQFFPSEDPVASLLASFGAFAAGFLARPFGSLVFGHVGDRFGRGRALWLSVAAMALPTLLLGLLPVHAQIGMAAPVLLVLMRLLQGLAVGGENGVSLTFLVEQARPGRRGFAGAWGPFGIGCGVLLGSAVGAVITGLLGEAAVEAWAWRLPFLLGLGVAGCGLYIRRGLPGLAEAPAAASPVREAFRTQGSAMLRILGVNAVLSMGFYLCFIFAVSYLQRVSGIGTETALDINTLAMAAMIATTLAAGALSDRIGRRPVLLAAAGALLLLAWPLFWLMRHPAPWVALLGQVGLAIPIGATSGTVPALMAELLPRRLRCTGLSFALNLGFGALGGATPLVATWLMTRSQDDLSPAWLLMGAAAVSLAATWGVRETAHAPMD